MSSTPQRNRTRGAKTPTSERKRLDGLWEDNQWKCNCEPRRKAALRQVKKDSKNKGRWFFTCASTPQCDFFLWQDLANIRQPGSGSPSTYSTYSNTNTNPNTSQQQHPASATQASRLAYTSSASNPQYSQPRSATATSTQTLQPTTPSKRRRVADDAYENDAEFSDLGSDDERQLAAITDRSVSQATRKQDALNANPRTQAQQTPKNSHSVVVDAASGLPTPSVARTLFPTSGSRDNNNNNNNNTTTTTIGAKSTSLANSPSTPSSTSTATLLAAVPAGGEEEGESTQAQVMQLLRRTTVNDDVLDHVQTLLATAERKMQGLVRGRDAVRSALREKDVRIAELQERITQLENRGFMQEGRIREMKTRHGI